MLVCSDEAQQAEAVQVLSAVLQFEKQQSGGAGDDDDDNDDDGDGGDRNGADDVGGDDDNVNVQSSEALARAYHTLAMLYYLLHNNDKVMDDMIGQLIATRLV